jgi:hypothetical protein
MSSTFRLGKSASICSAESPPARLASTVRRVTRVPLKTGSPPQIPHSGMLNTSLRRFQSLSDSPRYAAPSLGFNFELLLSSFGQSIIFGAPVVFGISPKRGNPALFLHPVEGGKKRAWLNDKSAAGELLDSARDSQAMHFAGEK